MSDRTYNGWSNYETWAVKLWLDNDEATYNYWRDRTREIYTTSEAREPLTLDQVARYDLADELKRDHEEQAPEVGGVFGDLS